MTKTSIYGNFEATSIIDQYEKSPKSVNKPTEKNWGLFDKYNSQHKRIQANLHVANIVITLENNQEVADMKGWFNRFLKSDKSPVKKPLMDMTPKEVSKIIKALDGVAVWKNSI